MDFGPTYHPSKYLLDTIRSVVKGEVTEVDPHDGEEIEEHKGTKPHKHPHEDMDPVNPKAVKKKFKDRKDKDIDNDGDVDGSDKYLHKRRKAISKAISKEEVELEEKLKFEGKFKVGDVIRAYDFKPMKGRREHYIQGKIVKAGTMNQGAKVYEIKISNDSGKTSGDRVGDIGYVPMQVAMMEYPGRIVKVSDVKEGLEDNKDNPANRQHLCAKNVVHEEWGDGQCIPTMHADPDENGNIAWYDVMFEHGIEAKVSIDELKVTKAEDHMHASYDKKKKKVKEMANGDKKKKEKKDDIDVKPKVDDKPGISEEMTDAQKKKREEIVLAMKDKMPEFKKKYGDRAKDVMYATATKMAMKEEFELDEISRSMTPMRDRFGSGKKKLSLKDFKPGMFVMTKKGEVGKIVANEPRADQVVVKMNKTKKEVEMNWKKLGLYTEPRLKGLVQAEALDKEDEPKVKEIIKKLKGASQAHAGQAKDLEKAVDEGRGRPKKDGAASDELENIQMQLRKSISMRGLKKVQFSNGKHMMVKPGMARAALDKIDSIQMGKDKQKAVKYIMKSPENLKDFVNK